MKRRGKILFSDDILFYLENPKEFTKKKTIRTVNKIAGSKINIQKWIVFLYTCNEQSENEIKKIIPIYNSIKKNKVLRNMFSTRSVKLILWNYKNIVESN